MIKKVLSITLSVVLIFAVWIITAAIIDAPLILPYPPEVLKAFCFFVTKKLFWISFGFTVLRVFAAFLISLSLGTALGLLCGSSDFIKNVLEVPLSLMRSTPVVAVILIVMLWFTSKTVPVVVGILMALPIITTAVTTGIKQSAEKLNSMIKAYRLSKQQVFIYIKLPQLKPHFLSSCESIFGLCWKVVAAGEVLSLPRFGLGTIMHTSQVHLETAQVIAVTFVLVAVSYLLQKLLGLLNKDI